MPTATALPTPIAKPHATQVPTRSASVVNSGSARMIAAPVRSSTVAQNVLKNFRARMITTASTTDSATNKAIAAPSNPGRDERCKPSGTEIPNCTRSVSRTDKKTATNANSTPATVVGSAPCPRHHRANTPPRYSTRPSTPDPSIETGGPELVVTKSSSTRREQPCIRGSYPVELDRRSATERSQLAIPTFVPPDQQNTEKATIKRQSTEVRLRRQG